MCLFECAFQEKKESRKAAILKHFEEHLPEINQRPVFSIGYARLLLWNDEIEKSLILMKELESKLEKILQSKAIQEIQINHLDIAKQIDESIEPQKIQDEVFNKLELKDLYCGEVTCNEYFYVMTRSKIIPFMEHSVPFYLNYISPNSFTHNWGHNTGKKIVGLSKKLKISYSTNLLNEDLINKLTDEQQIKIQSILDNAGNLHLVYETKYKTCLEQCVSTKMIVSKTMSNNVAKIENLNFVG